MSNTPDNESPKPLLSVTGLSVDFRNAGRRSKGTSLWHRAVDNVSLSIDQGRSLGLVGESGCGKTTLSRAVLRLVEPTHGQVWFDGTDVLTASRSKLFALRKRMQIVFQDTSASLNPRMTIGNAIGEPLVVHRVGSTFEQRDRIDELLNLVGLHEDIAARYPHELSGGQRQRVGIARALALRPDLLVCDEPASALDVSVQAQIINLLSEMKKTMKLTYLFVSHDLAVVRHFCDNVAVMFEGKIVESAPTEELYANPQHPYTMSLLASATNALPRQA